jgi:predicted alpha/beta hydrolase family esterase
MKVSDADIVMVPGHGGSGPDHWQSRWQARLSTARRMALTDWEGTRREPWIEAVVEAVGETSRPVILIAHSIGTVAVAHAAPLLGGRIAGAYLVGVPDADRPDLFAGASHDFGPVPLAPLPFPSVVVASRDDPYCAVQRAADFAEAWGSEFVDAGEAGHINAASGHGPWPEGLMRFAGFLSKL